MDKVVKSFVTDKFPDFIVAEHEKFKLFIEAYYEWMEIQNTEKTTKVKELYKVLPNTGALISNSDELSDIDETVDGFVDYFRKSVIPIVIKESKTTDRFFIKKIRDVYLSKGTPKSFKLLFRLMFDEDIEIFETKNDILKPSNGQYVQFPSMHFVVTDFSENLSVIDFTFSKIVRDTDSEDEDVGAILSASAVGVDNLGRAILRAQLAEDYVFNKGDSFLIFDVGNPNVFIRMSVLPTLSEVEIIEGGSLHNIGDTVEFESLALGTKTIAVVTNIGEGTVEELYVRDRGSLYNEGDLIRLSGNNGVGGSAIISEVNRGRVSKIDGKSLINSNNVLSNKFEGAYVPINDGGKWRSLPKVIVSVNTSVVALPYGGSSKGSGISITATSRTIGTLNELFFGEKPYFLNDTTDIVINTPTLVAVQNFEGIESGTLVSFQRFEPFGGAFTLSAPFNPYDSDSAFDNISDVGEWVNLGKYAIVDSVREDEGVLSLKRADGKDFVDSEGYLSIKTKDRKQIIKIAKVDASLNVLPTDDMNVPFRNIVSQISKATLRATTVGVSNSNKNFADERGFLNSSSGGVLQDNFFYSDFTYIVKTRVSMERWKEKVKTLLHPAGTLMLAQLVMEQEASVNEVSSETDVTYSSFSDFTFDTSLEHYSDTSSVLQVTADSVKYTTAPFEIVNSYYPNGNEITADSYYENEFVTYNFQKGDSWWDFEPLGLIADTTTQSRVGNVVAESQTFYKRFDSVSKNSRLITKNEPMLSQVVFGDLDFNNQYYAYDSDSYSNFFASFDTDSDGEFRQISYTSIAQPNRQTRSAVTLRKKELKLMQEQDLNNALAGTFVFNDPIHGAINNIEGYEYKWNSINNKRTINIDGWSVIGYASSVQNLSNNKRLTKPENSISATTKTPFNQAAYTNTWIINNSYNPLINTNNVVNLSAVDNSTTADPRTLTASRKLT